VCSGASQRRDEQMIEVWIIEELERRKRKDRRDEARVWIPDPDEEPLPDERPTDNAGDPPRVIVIDL
jgi:hypothetical protein